MSTIKENVDGLLAKYKPARNDDKYLLARYWYEIDNIPFPMTGNNFIKMATTPASIIRARALIQAEGRWPSDEQVTAQRAALDDAFRESIGKNNDLPT